MGSVNKVLVNLFAGQEQRTDSAHSVGGRGYDKLRE